MTPVDLSDVVLDETTYPRSGRDRALVGRYAGAMADGATFPPLVLESATGRLLDGWHRYEAALSLGRTVLPADHHTVPEGMSARLYAATLQTLGLPMADGDYRTIVRDLYTADESLSITDLARKIGRPRQTVQGWVQDIAEAREEERTRQRAARQLAVLLLRDLDWTDVDTAEVLGVHRNTVHSDAESGAVVQDRLDEALLRLALDLIPCDVRADAESVAEEWREELIFAAWSEDERELLKRLRDGQTIVVSQRGQHAGLIRWAEDAELYVRIDRRSEWGNPFETPADGDRETVIRNYGQHYLPHKPSLLSRLGGLRGKALGCWCVPEPCHGHVLLALVEAGEC